MRLEHARFFAVSSAIRPMTNANGTFGTRGALILEVHTREGLVGYGEAYLERGLEDVPSIVESFGSRVWPEFCRVNPGDSSVWPTFLSEPKPPHGALRPLMAAASALDIAIWDIRGQVDGVPIWSLLTNGNAARRSICAYASGIPYRDVSDQIREDRLEVDRLQEAGFQIFKMRIGRDAELDCRRIESLATSIGQGCSIAVDANRSLSSDSARRVADVLVDVGGLWLEEPFQFDDRESLEELRSKSSVTIATGEAAVDPAEIDFIARNRLAEYLQPDPGALGGLSGAWRVGSIGTREGLTVMPHVWGSGIAVACALHFVSALPGPSDEGTACEPVRPVLLEVESVGSTLLQGVLTEPLALEPYTSNCGEIPCALTGAGLGVEIDQEFLAAHCVGSWEFRSLDNRNQPPKSGRQEV